MGQNKDSGLYWHHRVKQFKYMLLDELNYFADTARFTVKATANTFSSSTSEVMNYALKVKQNAEKQQGIVIKIRMGKEPLSSHEIAIVNEQLLGEFLFEALEGASVEDFNHRLKSLISMQPHLGIFVDVYDTLSQVSGEEWNKIQHITKEYTSSINDICQSTKTAVETMFNNMDYTDLPADLEAGMLSGPFVKKTNDTLEELQKPVDTWLHELIQLQKQLH